MQRRSDLGVVRVDRTIPLWGIVTGVALLVGQAFVVVGTQQRQGDKIDVMSTQVSAVVGKVDSMSQANATLTASMTQLQGQIVGLQNRMTRIEAFQDAQRGASTTK